MYPLNYERQVSYNSNGSFEDLDHVQRRWTGAPLRRMSNDHTSSYSGDTLYLVNLDDDDDPHSPEFASKLLSAVKLSSPLMDDESYCGSDCGSDDEISYFSPQQCSKPGVDNLLRNSAESLGVFEALRGKSRYMSIQASEDAPSLLVKRVLTRSIEYDLLLLLNEPLYRDEPDNPVPELVRVIEQGQYSLVAFEDKVALDERGVAPNDKFGFMQQMLRYLAFLHSMDITCVDVTPSNVLVNSSLFGDVYEILDYSSCIRFPNTRSRTRIPSSDVTRVHGSVPEVAQNPQGSCDPFAADVWALGRTLESIGYNGTELQRVVDAMVALDPGGRPAASAALEVLYSIAGE